MLCAFDTVLAKYNWAKKHADHFESAVGDFRRSNPHTIGHEENVRTGQVRFYVASVPIIPDELAFMLGDALHNLRSTLDHLAYALVTIAGGKPDRGTSFPISSTAEAYRDSWPRKVPGLRQPCYKVLDRIQAYKDGVGHRLWQLHQLEIVDKHRLLLTIASVPVGRTMTPSERAAFEVRKTIIGPRAFAMRQYAFAASKPIQVPMQAGYELGTFQTSEVNENMGFAFDIAINEPNIVEGIMPTFIFLRGVGSEILRIINDFGPYL